MGSRTSLRRGPSKGSGRSMMVQSTCPSDFSTTNWTDVTGTAAMMRSWSQFTDPSPQGSWYAVHDEGPAVAQRTAYCSLGTRCGMPVRAWMRIWMFTSPRGRPPGETDRGDVRAETTVDRCDEAGDTSREWCGWLSPGGSLLGSLWVSCRQRTRVRCSLTGTVAFRGVREWLGSGSLGHEASTRTSFWRVFFSTVREVRHLGG
mmetsp:Transcript_57700/g.103106  ORF Transcript_57700/g.103106 Transcript_57700/m.103106 type:complete len:203 (-) Transcript_57700:940-1548(-)